MGSSLVLHTTKITYINRIQKFINWFTYAIFFDSAKYPVSHLQKAFLFQF